jgi:hypothetical protein
MGWAFYQFGGIPYAATVGSATQVGARPDYSHQALLLTLNEANLSEPDGVGLPGITLHPKDLVYYVINNSAACTCPDDLCQGPGVPAEACVWKGSAAAVAGVITPVDWNCDGDATDTGVAAGISGGQAPGGLNSPAGTDDWSNLFLSFQCDGHAND